MSTLENMLILHCAPTLFGIKQSNLFSCSMEDSESILKEMEIYNELLNSKDIYFKALYQCQNRIFILVYRKTKMFSYLSDRKVSYLLKSEGYEIPKTLDDLEKTLDFLGKRITGCEEFPHEIGFFLGYPKEDVFEYIKNSGKNYKFYGYWKVYGDEKNAEKTFWQYRKCKEVMENRRKSGKSVLKVLGVF